MLWMPPKWAWRAFPFWVVGRHPSSCMPSVLSVTDGHQGGQTLAAFFGNALLSFLLLGKLIASWFASLGQKPGRD